MAAGPLQDLTLLTPRSFTCSRYSNERYASVKPPACENRASSISPEPLARAMELFVVPKSRPIASVLMQNGPRGEPAEGAMEPCDSQLLLQNRGVAEIDHH